MAERLITVLTREPVPELLADVSDAAVKSRWERRTEDGRYETSILVEVGDSEGVMDALHGRFEREDEYRLVLIAVEASLPRPEPDDEEEPAEAAPSDAKESSDAPKRISREELYSDVAESADVTVRYMVMVALATVVAAGGMLRENVAVIIGAMVIAPLLGPNIALSLATTLADPKLARKSLIAGGAGLGISIALSLLIGAVLPVSLDNPEILVRAQVNFADIALALAAGAAGALAFTSGAPAGVIGVMVAVALLPPLVAVGLLMASGAYAAGVGAMLLVAVNLICINLAGVLTFLLQGISPRDWREERASRRATRVAIVIWLVLLGLLGALIVLRAPLEL